MSAFITLRNLSKQYLGKDYSKQVANGTEIKPEMIDGLSQASFPACMRELHRALVRDHHLRHGGRMQYGLFLKGIGLSLDDALRFWQREFSKKITTDQFMKQYAYNIRHNYGKEGKRADYTPYSCTRIIMGTTPGANEYHGCPYKTYDRAHLTQMLRQMRLGESAVSDIVFSAQKKDYQIACRKHFEYAHGNVTAESVGNHPNAWFERAAKLPLLDLLLLLLLALHLVPALLALDLLARLHLTLRQTVPLRKQQQWHSLESFGFLFHVYHVQFVHRLSKLETLINQFSFSFYFNLIKKKRQEDERKRGSRHYGHQRFAQESLLCDGENAHTRP